MLGRFDNASAESWVARKPLNGVLAESRAARKPLNGILAGHGRHFSFSFGRRKRPEKIRRTKAAENEV
jgi:hypothetical protein